MPLKLNIGLAQKIGQPAYSSLSAACYVELELESTLLQNDLDGFQRHVRHAYNACRQAIQDELMRHQRPGTSSDAAPALSRNGNGSVATPISVHETPRATQKQLEYAAQLAQQIRGLGAHRLAGLADKMFGRPLEELTTFEASSLIDTLRAIKDDRICLDDVLHGVEV